MPVELDCILWQVQATPHSLCRLYASEEWRGDNLLHFEWTQLLQSVLNLKPASFRFSNLLC